MSYKVKLDVFEGPFDLLVYLIENAQMNIYDIQVSEITNQYMEYITRMQAADIALGGEFMVLAAALIEIKSKMLLPRTKIDESDAAMEDPRTELVERLLEYKQFKTAAEFLHQQEAWNARIFEKPKEDLTPFTHEPEIYLNLDLAEFVGAFHLFLLKKQKVEEIQHYYDRVERQKVSVETKIEQIKNMFLLQKTHVLNFEELVPPSSSRYDVVLTFSSMLEMIRQRLINVSQLVNFGEITLTLNKEERSDQRDQNDQEVEFDDE